MRTELFVKPVDNPQGSWFYYYFDLSLFSNGLNKVSRSQNHPKVDLIFPVQPHAYDKWPFCNLFQLPEQTHLLLWATLLLDISERTSMKNATTVLDPSELENYNQLFWDLASRKLQKKFWTIVSEPAWKIHTTVPDLSEQASVKIQLFWDLLSRQNKFLFSCKHFGRKSSTIKVLVSERALENTTTFPDLSERASVESTHIPDPSERASLINIFIKSSSERASVIPHLVILAERVSEWALSEQASAGPKSHALRPQNSRILLKLWLVLTAWPR